MEFNLNEYIKNRLRDIEVYLKDINFANLHDDRAIENLPQELDIIFNKSPLYRVETNKFVMAIRNSYDYLKYNRIEFASTKGEVDAAILEFETAIKMNIREFKNNILSVFNKEGYKPNIINNDLGFIVVRIRKADDKKTENELIRLKDIIPCIYTLMYMIKDKRFKANNFLDLVNAKYSVRDPEYPDLMGKYIKILNEKDYDKFVDLYEREMKLLTSPKLK